ncbi:MAG: pyruvate kinase [Patescibacteria group bacterium]
MKKKTKIVATIGPASENKEILRKMIQGGMNVARLNFSHGDYASHTRIIDTIRELSREMNTSIGIMADLQGPRIRTIIDNDFEIKSGEKILVYDSSIIQDTRYKIQDTRFFLLDYPGIIKDIEIGNEILIEDGLIKLKVSGKKDNYLEAEVIDGGTVKNEKGVNIPDAKLNIPVITPKDEEDLLFALGQNVDFVALSFVNCAKDILDLKDKIKKILGKENDLPRIVAKIERREAIKNMDEIIRETDAVMVARGDLGIEIEESKVAILQKEMIAKSLLNLKPVIVATQMLDSMIRNPRPTRAEVSDVSNAVIDHTDAAMLSGESANGKYPVESIETMSRIINDTEGSPFDDVDAVLRTEQASEYVDVIKGAFEISRSPEVKAILVSSERGYTAQLISHFRPEKPIYAAVNKEIVYRQLSLIWGVEPYFFENSASGEALIEKLIFRLKEDRVLKNGDKAVVIIGKIEGGKKANLIGVREV